MTTFREVRLKSYAVGLPAPENFEIAAVEFAPPAEGEVQVRNMWLSVDPFMRHRMNGGTPYSFALGQAMHGPAVGEVIASKAPSLRPGDLVHSEFAWREGFTAPASAVRKIDPQGLPPQVFLAAAGGTGLTAYVGLLRTAALKDGDVVFVSGGAGAVGSVAIQIAKALGHTVIASAGGPEKVAYLREIGADEVIDYKAEPDLTAALRRAAPGGIDVYFDNVGGPHLEAAINAARLNARMAICGAISTYNDAEPQPGPTNLMQVVLKQIRLEGFTVHRHADMQAEFDKAMGDWIRAGKVSSRETVVEGIENAPDAFLALFSGANTGKMLVKVA